MAAALRTQKDGKKQKSFTILFFFFSGLLRITTPVQPCCTHDWLLCWAGKSDLGQVRSWGVMKWLEMGISRWWDEREKGSCHGVSLCQVMLWTRTTLIMKCTWVNTFQKKKKNQEAEEGSLRPAWSTEWVPGQSGLQRDPVSKKKKQKKRYIISLTRTLDNLDQIPCSSHSFTYYVIKC